MKILKKRWFLILGTACALWTAPLAAETVRLRGYGTVQASFGTNQAEFLCESPEKADILFAKLNRDLAGLGALSAERIELAVPSGKIPAFRFASGRCAVVGRRGNVVVVLDADSSKTLETQLQRTDLKFPSVRPYPGYLDYYDLRALKFYKSPMRSLLGLGLEKHWSFAKKFGIEGFVTHGLSIAETKGPGLIPFLPFDYELEEARKADGILTLCPTFGGELPLWIFNRNPEKTAKPQRSTIVTNWIPGVDGMFFDNDGPGFPPETSPVLAFQKQVMEHYVNHPALGGWQLYCGKPIGDQLSMGMFGVLWDASEEGLQAQIEWLKQHYTLRELSLRWTGNPNAFRSWNEVKPVQLMDLIGGDWEKDRLLLSDRTWLWRKTPKNCRELPPPDDGTAWVPVTMAPSHRCNFIDSGSGYYKLTLPKSSWVLERKNRVLYLKAAVHTYDANRLTAWINGRKFQTEPAYSPATKQLGFQLPAGTLKGDGSDVIVIQTPDGRSDGRIHGPICLSELPARNYPYPEAHINARYVDSLRFQTDRIVERNRAMFSTARAIDRNRPMSLSGADTPIMTALAPFFGEQGIAMQSTSTDGFFYPALPDRGQQYGFYFIGEPSGPVTTTDRFDRNFGILFFHGCSATSIFMDIEQYMKFESEKGHLTKRASLIRLIGRYLLEQPKIGLLGTTDSFLLGSSAPWNWNIGRGEIQSAHFEAAMMTEQELENGIAVAYPLIIDAGSDVMNAKTIDLIRDYVRNGGTFVVLPETGRHSDLKQNVYPISELSGFRTVAYNAQGSIRFSDTPSLFRRWAGKTMNGNGSARDWKNIQTARGVLLEKTAPDAEVIAVWSKQGNPAVGLRKIGKGRIITLGASFWRDARDVQGKWLPGGRNRILEEMLSDLGARKTSDADSERIWVRKAVTKNGLENWLIAVNMAENEPFQVRSTLSCALSFRPAKVMDALTGKEVHFTFSNGTLTLPDVAFEKYQTRIFSVARPVTVSEALVTWWGEKVKYWKQGPEIKLPYLREPVSDVLSFDRWKFTSDRENRISSTDAWRKSNFDDSSWKNSANGSWKILFPELANYRGTALYRRTFRIPPSWKGRRIVFHFLHTAIHDQAEFYLNNRRFRFYDAPAQHRELLAAQSADVTELLNADGENLLAVKVTGGTTPAAGLCDSIWMEPEMKFDGEYSLNGSWTCLKKDFLTGIPAKIPGKIHGRFLRRTFRIPAEWKGKNIWLRVVVPEINIAAVVLNDRNRNMGGFVPWGNRTIINITDLVKAGEENTIELWHRHTIPVFWRGLSWNWPTESFLSVSDVAVGYTD